MNYITTTNLRSRTSQIIKALDRGDSISLIHRSKMVGIIKPLGKEPVKIIDVEKLERLLDEIRPKKLIKREDREKVFRKRLFIKHGKSISGR